MFWNIYIGYGSHNWLSTGDNKKEKNSSDWDGQEIKFHLLVLNIMYKGHNLCGGLTLDCSQTTIQLLSHSLFLTGQG